MEWRHRAYSPSDVAPWRWLLKEEQTHGGHAFTHETVDVEDPGKRTLQSAPLEHQHRRIHEGSAVKSTYFGGYFRNSTPDSIACEICYWIKNRLVAHFSVVSWRPNSKIISKPEKNGYLPHALRTRQYVTRHPGWQLDSFSLLNSEDLESKREWLDMRRCESGEYFFGVIFHFLERF